MHVQNGDGIKGSMNIDLFNSEYCGLILNSFLMSLVLLLFNSGSMDSFFYYYQFGIFSVLKLEFCSDVLWSKKFAFVYEFNGIAKE